MTLATQKQAIEASTPVLLLKDSPLKFSLSQRKSAAWRKSVSPRFPTSSGGKKVGLKIVLLREITVVVPRYVFLVS